MRPAVAALLAAASIAGGGLCANAQNAVGIAVHVHEVAGQAPVHDALVRLVGSSAQRIFLGRTDGAGNVLFGGARCESGLLLVEANGYEPMRQRISCDVAGAVIDVPLQRVLTVIGSTRSTPAASAKATISLSPDSAVRRVNRSMAEALDQLAGLSSREQGIGFSAGVRGQDPSMTEYSLNGAPLGAGAASLAINTDLLSSASVDEANDAVALFSASPTGSPRYSSEFRIGNYEDTFQKYQASGTVHGDGLGYVFVHTSRGLASALNDKTYRDESGLEYAHRGVRHTTGNLVRLTDAVGVTSVAFTASMSAMSAQPIPAYYSGAVPAGPGPGTHQDQLASNPVLFVSAPLRAGQLSLSAARWSLAGWTDDSARVVGLAPAPQTTFDRTSGTDLTLSFASAPTRNRTVNVSYTSATTSSNAVSQAVVAGMAFGGSFETAARTTEASFSESWHANPRLPFGLTLKNRTSNQLGGAFELGWSAQYVLSPRARLRYAGATGTKLVDLGALPDSHVLADPGSAEFDCANRAAFATGPGATGARSHAINHDLSGSMNAGRSSLTLSLYQHSYENASIGAIPFVAASLPAGYFPAGYLDAIAQQYQAAAGCAGELTPDRIFIQQAFGSADVVYRGAAVNGHITLSRAWSADFSAGVERARITGGDSRLAATPYFPGSFVPGVPSYKSNVVLTWQPSENVSALVSTTLAGPHNARQLPAYAVVNAALERKLSPSSSAALLVTNVFDTLTNPFVSTRYAVPLADGFGRTIPTFASPLVARRVELRYSLQIGTGGQLR